MTAPRLSKRKLESYRRAEIVAQASRQMITAPGGQPSHELLDIWSGAVLDWMAVTGKLKYAPAKRRGRHK